VEREQWETWGSGYQVGFDSRLTQETWVGVWTAVRMMGEMTSLRRYQQLEDLMGLVQGSRGYGVW
jgi:hypothetical protein